MCISQEDAIILEEAKEKLGFKSDYQFAKAAVRIMLKIIKKGMEEPISSFPEEIAAIFYDMANYSNPELGKKNNCPDETELNLLFKGQIRHGDCLNEGVHTRDVQQGSVRAYSRQFMEAYYKDLFVRVKNMKTSIRSDGYTPMDIFHSTIEDILNTTKEFKAYEEFEEWALAKFNRIYQNIQ
ncbi:hypothetical protein [Porphyromonas gulae]|uniref:hypothetical protein n=1 Tax=Porphyromonas gulae TaxID=111105 RepID=UPI001269E91E|nr:hypothetical protein [Porphyromonas gulae]